MRGARVRLELLQFACLIVSQLGSISTLCLIPTVHSFSSLRVQRNTHGVLANPDLSQAMAPSKKKRTHAVFCISSAHRLASTSKPRFGGEKVRLGDCFPYIKNGYNVRQGKDKGGMPITRIETLSDNRFNRDKVGYADIFSTEGLENHILEDGDILMSHINSLPYLGRSVMYRARPGEVFIHGMNLLRLKADRSVVEPGYAELYFRSPRFKQHVLKIAKKAVNQASFSVSDLKEIEFPLMSLCDQRDVIEKLSSVTTQIEHCQRAIGKLDSLVKSRFVEIFGDLKLNKYNWPIEPFESFAVIDTHMANNLDAYANKPHIGIDSIESNSGRLSGYRTVAEDGIISGKYPFTAQHIIYSKIRPALNKAALPDFDGVCSADAYPILPAKERCNRIYLAQVMRSSYFLDYVLPLSGRAQMPKVNKKALQGFSMPLPPLELQQEFAAFVAQVDKSRFVRDHEMNFR